jgi:hypothetical protein
MLKVMLAIGAHGRRELERGVSLETVLSSPLFERAARLKDHPPSDFEAHAKGVLAEIEGRAGDG